MKRYVTAKRGYFRSTSAVKPIGCLYYMMEDGDGKVYAISETGKVICEMTHLTDSKRIDQVNTWMIFDTLKETKAYLFKCQLDGQ